MVCCIICSGEGFCSNLLSIVISVTFSFHAFGIASPHWMCDGGENCELHGLFYSCFNSDCKSEVINSSLLVLALMVLISSFCLMFVFCCMTHCTDYKYRHMTPVLGLFIGGWFLTQEIFTTAILITIAIKYDRIGWSAYVFTVPGMIFLGIVFFVLVYMWCYPEKRVFPS
ncbi:hypothetical protein ACF0H5_004350 [Mactra antiquata]